MLATMKPVMLVVGAASTLLLVVHILTLAGQIATPSWLPRAESIVGVLAVGLAIVGVWKHVKWGPGPYRQ